MVYREKPRVSAREAARRFTPKVGREKLVPSVVEEVAFRVLIVTKALTKACGAVRVLSPIRRSPVCRNLSSGNLPAGLGGNSKNVG